MCNYELQHGGASGSKRNHTCIRFVRARLCDCSTNTFPCFPILWVSLPSPLPSSLRPSSQSRLLQWASLPMLAILVTLALLTLGKLLVVLEASALGRLPQRLVRQAPWWENSLLLLASQQSAALWSTSNRGSWCSRCRRKLYSCCRVASRCCYSIQPCFLACFGDWKFLVMNECSCF